MSDPRECPDCGAPLRCDEPRLNFDGATVFCRGDYVARLKAYTDEHGPDPRGPGYVPDSFAAPSDGPRRMWSE